MRSRGCGKYRELMGNAKSTWPSCNSQDSLRVVHLVHENMKWRCESKEIYLIQRFFKKNLYWSIIAFQCCVSFSCITKWISYMYTYIPISPPSCISLTPSLSHHSRWSQSTELISLCDAAASHSLSILHLVVCICHCYSLTSSQLTLHLPRVLKSIQYVCVFIPVLPLGSPEPFFFFRFHIYVLAYGIFLFLTYFTLHDRL